MRDSKGRFVKEYSFTPEILEKMSNAKKGKPSWNKGKALTKEHREKLSKARLGKSPVNKGLPMSEDVKLKISSSRKGKAAWNKGLGNKTSEAKKIKSSIEYKLWREAVFARDNWICQKYNIKGCKLHPHHILNFSSHPELRMSVENGITLSERAHIEFHKKYGKKNNTREQLEKFLKEDCIFKID